MSQNALAAEPIERRIRIICVSPELLLQLLKVDDTEVDGCIISFVSDEIPQDAKVVGCAISQESGQVMFKIESESFPVVDLSTPVPRLNPTYKRTRKKD